MASRWRTTRKRSTISYMDSHDDFLDTPCKATISQHKVKVDKRVQEPFRPSSREAAMERAWPRARESQLVVKIGRHVDPMPRPRRKAQKPDCPNRKRANKDLMARFTSPLYNKSYQCLGCDPVYNEPQPLEIDIVPTIIDQGSRHRYDSPLLPRHLNFGT